MNAWQKAACAGAAALALLAAGLLVASCTTPVNIDMHAQWKGFKLSAHVEANGSITCSISGDIAPGKCIKVTGRASDGSVTTTTTVTVPGSWTLPAGTTSQDMEIVDCPKNETGDASSAPPQPAPSAYVEIYGAPVAINGVDGGIFKNAVYHFRVYGSASPWNDVLPILVGGPGTPVPPNVDVLEFTQVVPEALGARVRAADTEPFAEFRMTWNGRPYADLALGVNAMQYTAPHHWSVVETLVVAADLVPFDRTHAASTWRRAQSESSPTLFAGELTFAP